MTTFQTVIPDTRPVDLHVDRKTGETRAVSDRGREFVTGTSEAWPDLRLATEGERFQHALAVTMHARQNGLRVVFDDDYAKNNCVHSQRNAVK